MYPECSQFRQLPSSRPDYLRGPGDATVGLAQTCSRMPSTGVASYAGPPSDPLALQLQQADTFRRWHGQACNQRQRGKSVWSFQFVKTVVSKPVDIRIELVHPVDSLHVTALKWSVEPAVQVAPVVREDPVENAIVRVEVFVWVVFYQALELASQLCGLPQ